MQHRTSRRQIREKGTSKITLAMSIAIAAGVTLAAIAGPIAGGGGGTRDASAAGMNVNLDQCANQSTPCDWQNGNLNGNNSAYAEGKVVPFRLALEGLSAGTHSIHINYDFTAGGSKAYDFLATYNATETVALCASGGGGVSSMCPSLPAATTFTFPSDATIVDSLPVSGAETFSGVGRNLTAFGATVTSITGPVHSGSASGNSTGDFVVNFTSTGSGVLFTWGGHLAQSAYWNLAAGGAADGASLISGAPWHMRTQQLDAGGNKNQDRSIQPSALAAPSPTSTATATQTSTATSTPTNTATNTPTNTATNTATNTPANTATNTPTNTATNTATNTPTTVPTHTVTSVPTRTVTSVPTGTSVVTTTRTVTGTSTAAATHTVTTTSTSVPTNTNTPTNTATNTPTNTPTSVPTSTNTPTNTATNTPTNTATNTPTNTATNTPANTATNTPTNTATNTPTNTVTNTAVPTRTQTATRTSTPRTSTPAASATAVAPTATNTVSNQVLGAQIAPPVQVARRLPDTGYGSQHPDGRTDDVILLVAALTVTLASMMVALRMRSRIR